LISYKEKVVNGKERIINVGNIPARYLLIEIEKGVPFPKNSDMKIYGIHHKEIDEVLGEGYSSLLFDKTY
jgi:hypothetical protein